MAGQKVVNLALQGGGSHGAFTWGVLDRLLEEEAFYFEGICGTSAGAANAVVLADGVAAGGREGARQALRKYWQRVSDLWSRGPFKPSLIGEGNSDFGLENSFGFRFIEPMTHFAPPYQLNPFNLNPFKDMLAEALDFERVRRQTAFKLFVCATDVQTATVKIFTGKELTVDHVLASTCLPLLMQTVEIDGGYYWDGMMRFMIAGEVFGTPGRSATSSHRKYRLPCFEIPPGAMAVIRYARQHGTRIAWAIMVHGERRDLVCQCDGRDLDRPTFHDTHEPKPFRRSFRNIKKNADV